VRTERAAATPFRSHAPRGAGSGTPRKAIDRAIRSFQAGRDREGSFRVLFDTYRAPLLRFFARKGFSPEEQSDLAQETFLGIYKGLGGFRHESRFESWLYRLATTTYLKRLRAAATDKRRGREVVHDETAPPVAETRPLGDPLGGVLREERREALRQAVRELPGQMRKCLTLRIYHELSYREIASVMRIELDTVKAHLFQAREKLRHTVDVAAFEPPTGGAGKEGADA